MNNETTYLDVLNVNGQRVLRTALTAKSETHTSFGAGKSEGITSKRFER